MIAFGGKAGAVVGNGDAAGAAGTFGMAPIEGRAAGAAAGNFGVAAAGFGWACGTERGFTAGAWPGV